MKTWSDPGFTAVVGDLRSASGGVGDPRRAEAQTGVNNSYGYDANGNQTTRTINGVTLTLAYDAEGHLVSVTCPSITPAEGAKYQSSVKIVTAKRGG